MTSQTEFLTSYECIKISYTKAMTDVETALSHEEQQRPQEAIAAYERGIKHIEHIFQIPVGLPDRLNEVQPEWNDACIMIQKLKSTKTEVAYRLKVLLAEHGAQNNDNDDNANAEEATEQLATQDEPLAKKRSMLLENPTTFYDINNAESGSLPKNYRQIINGLRHVISDKNCNVTFDTLFQAPAKLYKIHANGTVTSMAGEPSISLVLCTVGDEWLFLNGIYFIQCTFSEEISPEPMIWLYPLIPSVTICYRTEYGAFIFPDLESNEIGSVFGIMISDPTAADSGEELTDLQQFFLDLLEAVLAGEIEKLAEPPTARPARDTSEQVSKNIVCAADFIARNLIKGAEKTGELMIKSTPYIMSKMTPADSDAPPVSSTVQTSVEVAKNITSTAAGVTGWVAGKVGSASMAVGRFLAPHIQTQGANILEKGFGYDSQEANNKMEGALTIAASAVEGISSVYNGIETSAKILGTSLSNNSVMIIQHKYGPSAGNVAAGTFETIGNAFNVSQNVNYMTPKGIAKKMAKNTGKAVVGDYKRHLRQESQYVRAGVLCPDLTALKESSSSSSNIKK